MKSHNLIYIGAGPATMFSVLHLLEQGYREDILIIEKGKSLKDRQSNEILSGSFGAGTYSDSKLSSSMLVGGDIPNLTEEGLVRYSDILLSYINKFKVLTPYKDLLNWGYSEDFDVSNTSLTWGKHKLCHVGTDVGQITYKEIESYIDGFPNVKFLFETEVEEVIDLNGKYQIIVNKKRNKKSFTCSKSSYSNRPEILAY